MKIKKILFYFFTGLLIILFINLIGFNNSPNYGKRPMDYKNTKWVSQDPNIYFVVPEEFPQESTPYLYGKINYDGKVIDMKLWFDYSSGVGFSTLSDSLPLFGGTCEFAPNYLIVSIDRKDDMVFNGEYLDITFYRE